MYIRMEIIQGLSNMDVQIFMKTACEAQLTNTLNSQVIGRGIDNYPDY